MGLHLLSGRNSVRHCVDFVKDESFSKSLVSLVVLRSAYRSAVHPRPGKQNPFVPHVVWWGPREELQTRVML